MRTTATANKSVLELHVYTNGKSNTPLYSYLAQFRPNSKGKFDLIQKEETIAHFDFSPILPPHVSASGKWKENKFFNAALISSTIMQLSIFDNQTGQWVVITFEKDTEDDTPSSFDQYYKYIFMGVMFILSFVVSKGVQKCVINKKKAEVMEILAEDQKQGRNNKNARNNKNKKTGKKKN